METGKNISICEVMRHTSCMDQIKQQIENNQPLSAKTKMKTHPHHLIKTRLILFLQKLPQAPTKKEMMMIIDGITSVMVTIQAISGRRATRVLA